VLGDHIDVGKWIPTSLLCEPNCGEHIWSILFFTFTLRDIQLCQEG